MRAVDGGRGEATALTRRGLAYGNEPGKPRGMLVLDIERIDIEQ